MKKLATLAGGIFAISVSTTAVQAATIQWADWQSASGYYDYYDGYKNVQGSFGNGTTVTLSALPSTNYAYMFPFKGNGTQLNGGINYWATPDAYAYIPTNEDGVYAYAIPFRISFSNPVKDPIIAVSGFGIKYPGGSHKAGNWVIDTTQVDILSHGKGFSGNEYTPLHIDPSQSNKIIGDNGNGIIQFHGTFTDINIVSSTASTFFTVGVSAVPVPAAFWLFGSGLMALVGIARRRT